MCLGGCKIRGLMREVIYVVTRCLGKERKIYIFMMTAWPPAQYILMLVICSHMYRRLPCPV